MGKGKVGMGTHRWMAALDGSKFHPFRIFQNYYIHYSTWLGAAWPLGIVALLVIYCGSDIISWGKHPNTQDTSMSPVGIPPTPFTYSIPPIGLQFFSPLTGLMLNESFVRFEFSVCTKTVTKTNNTLPSGLFSNLGPNVTIGSLFSPFIYTTSVSCTPLPLSYSCGLGSCPNQFPDMMGSMTSTSQKYVSAKMILCDGTTASFPVDESLSAMPGTVCSSGACTRTVQCVDSVSLNNALTNGFIAINLGSSIDPELLKVTDLNDIGFNSSVTFLYDSRYTIKPDILFQAMRYQVLPVFFGATTDYYFTQYLSSESTYGNLDGTSTRATFAFALHPLAMDIRILPISVFTMLSRFGQVIAACAIANIFIKRFNFISFYAIADESYFVPDISTRKFLLANRKTRVKEFENMLLYVFTFGGSERFGLQTRQLFQFFNDRTKRFDRKETEAVVEDIQKFLMSRRIGKFVNEEEKVGRSVEANYNITALGGRLSRVEAAMQGLSKVPVPGADDENISDKAAIIREVETTLKLCTLQDELSKMKVICASLFPQQAKRERLAEQLAGK